MKYLKLFEDKKDREELEELIPELEDLCQDLKDHGFIVEIYEYTRKSIKFKKDEISIIPNDDICKYQTDYYIDGLTILIYKNEKTFYVNEIRNDLLFIKSYSRDELDLKINHYFYYDIMDDLYYCKNIKDLPKNDEVKSIFICFIKA